MSELKRCPFCGGEATPLYCENGNRYTSNVLYISKRGTIKCKKCELTLPRVYSKVSKAIEAWNTRKPVDAVLEHLEEEKQNALKLWDNNSRYMGYEHSIKIVKENLT